MIPVAVWAMFLGVIRTVTILVTTLHAFFDERPLALRIPPTTGSTVSGS